MVADIKCELEDNGYRSQHAEMSEPRHGWYQVDALGADDDVSNEQLGASLVTIRCDTDRAWSCVECGFLFDDGFGCICCLDPVCGRCVSREAHKCREARGDVGYTYRDIGAAQDLSTESVRRICEQALGKMRHRTVAQNFEPFIEPYATDSYEDAIIAAIDASRAGERAVVVRPGAPQPRTGDAA